MWRAVYLSSVLSLKASPFLYYKPLEAKTVNIAWLVLKLYIVVKILAVKFILPCLLSLSSNLCFLFLLEFVRIEERLGAEYGGFFMYWWCLPGELIRHLQEYDFCEKPGFWKQHSGVRFLSSLLVWDRWGCTKTLYVEPIAKSSTLLKQKTCMFSWYLSQKAIQF